MSGPRRKGAVAVAALVLAAGLIGGGRAASGAGPGSPNFVVILTDDMPSHELAAMPVTRALIADQGASFSRFYATYPLCCPARATLLTGLHMHNHQVRGNDPPYGGYERYRDLGSEARALPTWLKAAGYNTAHIGKYLNGWVGSPEVPPGWDEWHGQISEYNASQLGAKLYYDYKLVEKEIGGGPPVVNHYGFDPTDYETDVLQARAVEALGRLGEEAFLGSDQPFYLELAVHAPHFPYVPPPRYAGTMAGARLPRLRGVNEKNMRDKPSFLRREEKLNRARLGSLAADRRARFEMLRGVDDAVAAIVAKLAEEGELDNTYIILTADNGYFFGEHRIGSGKYLPYEPSARVPFAIRGPGIPAGGVSAELSANVDVAATVSAVAGAPPQTGVAIDGRSLLSFAANPRLRSQRPVLLEGDIGPGTGPIDGVPWAFRTVGRLALGGLRGAPDLEQEAGARRAALAANIGPAYRAIRTNRWLLIAYSTGETELYDMKRDRNQLRSLHKDSRHARVRRVLLRRLLSLASCSGETCQASYGKDPKPKQRRGRKGTRKPRS